MNGLRPSLGARNATSDVPSKNALICSKVASFASSMWITMPCIMTGPEYQSQTHFMLEIRQPFRLISYWNRLPLEQQDGFRVESRLFDKTSLELCHGTRLSSNGEGPNGG